MSKKKVKNLLLSLHDDIRGVLNNSGFEILDVNAPLDGSVDLVLFDVESTPLSELKLMLPEESDIHLFHIGNDLDLKEFLKIGGRFTYDISLLNSEIGYELLERSLKKIHSMSENHEFREVKILRKLQVESHLRSGYYEDIIAADAFNCGFNLFNIRSVINSFIYYFSYLSKEGVSAPPYELSFGVTGDFSFIKICSNVEDYNLEHIVQCLDDSNEQNPLYSLFTRIIESSHFLEAFQLKESGKLGLCAYLSKDTEIQGFKGICISAIERPKVVVGERRSIAELLDSFQLWQKEELDLLDNKNLPGHLFKKPLLGSLGEMAGSDPGLLLAIANFTRNKLIEDGCTAEPLSDCSDEEFKGALNTYPSKKSLSKLSTEDLIDIKALLGQTEILDQFQNIFHLEETKVDGAEELTASDLINDSFIETLESELQKVSGGADLNEEKQIVSGEEDNDEHTQLVKGSGEGNSSEDAFNISGEPAEVEAVFKVSGAGEENTTNETFTVSGSKDSQENIMRVRSAMSNAINNLNPEQKADKQEVLAAVENEIAALEIDGLDAKSLAQKCLEQYLNSKALKSINNGLSSLISESPSLVKEKENEINKLQEEIQSLKLEVDSQNKADAIAEDIKKEISGGELFTGEETTSLPEAVEEKPKELSGGELFTGLDEEPEIPSFENQESTSVEEGGIPILSPDKTYTEFEIQNMKRSLEEAARIKKQFSELERGIKQKELENKGLKKQLASEIKTHTEDKQRRQDLLTRSKELMSQEIEKRENMIWQEREKLNQIKSELSGRKLAQLSEGQDTEELKKELEGYKRRYKTLFENINQNKNTLDMIDKKEVESLKEKFQNLIKEKDEKIASLESSNRDGPAGTGPVAIAEIHERIDRASKKAQKMETRAKEAEEKAEEFSKQVKALEHKLKLSVTIQKNNEKEMMMKHKRQSNNADSTDAKRIKLLEKYMDKAKEEKHKMQEALTNTKKQASKLKSEKTAMETELNNLRKRLGKPAA